MVAGDGDARRLTARVRGAWPVARTRARGERLRWVVAMPDVKERLTAMGLSVGFMPQAQLAAREQAYTATWSRIIKASGFQPQ